MRQTMWAFGMQWERIWQEDDARPADAEDASRAWRRFFPDGDSIWVITYAQVMGWVKPT